MAEYLVNAKITSIAAPGVVTAADSGLAGNVNVGSHSWYVTFVSISGGETLPSAKSNVVTLASVHQVNLSNIPIGPGDCASRNIYRTTAGDTGSAKLVGSIANNTATTFVDNVADAGLGVIAPIKSTYASAVVNLQSGFTTTGNVAVANWFKFVGESLVYFVGSIVDAQNFTVTAPYTGGRALDTYAAAMIVNSFSPNLSMPIFASADQDIRDILASMVRRLDSMLGINLSTSFSVGTNAGVIMQLGSVAFGAHVLVRGNDGGSNSFFDIVSYAGTGSIVHASYTVSGTPAGRTYSVSGSSLKVAMSSGTYSINSSARMV